MSTTEPMFYKGATLDKTLYEFVKNGGVESFQAEADDVVLCSFPKCGTTWIKAIAYSIQHFDRAEDPLKNRFLHLIVPTIDYTDGGRQNGLQMLEKVVRLRPRVYHSHLPYQAMPESIRDNNCRIIYVARNPKDCILSAASFFKTSATKWPEMYWTKAEMAGAPIEEIVADRLDDFLADNREIYGPFTQHALSFWTGKTSSQMLFLHYEELKRSPTECIRRIADFIGRSDLTDDDIGLIAQRTAFDAMRSTSESASVPGVGNIGERASIFFAQGQSGGWKKRLSDEQSAKIERHIGAALEGSTLRFQYD